MAKLAASEATARSQLATSWQPAAVATPWTAATTGFGRCTMACIIALQAFMICGEIGAAAIGIAAARGQFLHVVAGGKGRAVGGDHHRAHALVVVDFLQRRVQFADQAFRQAVARRGPVEREHRDAAERLAQQDRRLRRRRRGRSGRSSKYPVGRRRHLNVTGGARRGRGRDMAIAKMSVAELEQFLHVEFPQAFSGGDIASKAPMAQSCLLRQRYSDRMLRPGGTVSGPTLMALADFAMYVVLLSAIGPIGLAVTTNLNINFLRKGAARPGCAGGGAAVEAGQAACGRRGQSAVGHVARSDRARDLDLFHSKYLEFSEVILAPYL